MTLATVDRPAAPSARPCPSPDVGDLAGRLATLPPDTLAALSALLGGLPTTNRAKPGG
jgi:hypothetical protein